MLASQTSLIGYFITFLCLIQSQFILTVETTVGPNNRPIIGILAQEISYHQKHYYSDKYDSYISASYVKYLECAGARVVPIWLDQNEDYYNSILKKINGVLFPGGAAKFNKSNGFADAARIIYRIASQMNSDGSYFPLWGTCLGFEVMTYIAAGDINICKKCDGLKNIALSLEFKSDFRNSRLFKHASDDIINIMKTENVTANFHVYCVTEEALAKVNLTDVYQVMTINHDVNGLTHVSSMEHFNFPFYGVQFHPEKNNFEWAVRLKGIPHSANAIKVSQYFANFFVDEARKNHHSFPSQEEEMKSLIANYPITYTALINSSFEQCYLFLKNNSPSYI